MSVRCTVSSYWNWKDIYKLQVVWFGTILYVIFFLFWFFLPIVKGVKNEANQNVYNVGYTWSTTAEAAGTKVYYTHEKNEDADKIYIPGPTNAHLYVYVSSTNFNCASLLNMILVA